MSLNEQPGTLVRKGKQCAFFCAFCVTCHALNVYFSVYVWGETFSRQWRYSGMCAITTSGVVCTLNNVTYQISLFPLYAFSYCASIFKVVHFINVYWNESASLPALQCFETNKKLLLLLLVAAFWNTNECFSSPGHWKDTENLKCFGRTPRDVNHHTVCRVSLAEGEQQEGHE